MASSLRELICKVTADTRVYQTGMARASQHMVDFGRTAKHTGVESTRAWDQQTAAAKTHATALEASSQALGRYVGMAAGLFGAGKLIQMADDYGQISARIQNATASSAEFGLAQSRLEEIASRTFRRYSEAADQFAQTARPMQELGFSTAQTLDSAEALGLALVAGASDAQRSRAAMDAWSKSMAEGRLNTDQFQTLLQQTPRVAQALGDALGKTTGELQQMARDGQLTAQVVVPALISQMGKLGDEVDRMPTTVADASNRFLDAMQKWAGGANEATGATQTLVGGIALVTKHMDLLATAAIAGGVGLIGSKMVLAGKDAVQMAQGIMQARTAQIALTSARVADAQFEVVEAARHSRKMANQKAFYASMVAEATTKTELEYATRRLQIATDGASRAHATATASVNALTAAENANAAAKSRMAAAGRLAMGVLGGPTGIALTVAAAAASWMLFRGNTDDAAQALVDFGGPADDVIKQLREMNAEVRAGQVVRLGEELEKNLAEIDKAIEQMVAKAQQLAPAYGAEARKLAEQFREGKLTAKELSAALAGLNKETLASTGLAGNQGAADGFTKLTAAVASAAEAADHKRGIMQQTTATNAQAAAQAGNTTAAFQQQASALDVLAASADAAGKTIQAALLSLPGQIERIGKSSREVAQLNVRDWIAGEALKQGITSEEDPRFQQLVADGDRYVKLVTAQASAQDAHARSTRSAAAAIKAVATAQTEAEKEAERRLEQYKDLAASQEREIALHGQVGRAAAMAYDTAKGALRDFIPEQKKALNEAAKWLDWLDYMAMIDAEIAKTADEHASRTGERFSSISVMADQAARNIQGHFADFLFNPFEDGMKGMVKGFSDAIRRMLAEAATAQLFELIGAAMAGYQGQGGWGNFIRGMGNSMTTDGKRAGGGEVRPYSAYDVTEHGPELLQMGGRQILMTGAQGGIVSPLMNKAGGGGGSGGSLQVVVNNHGNNQVNAREEKGRAPDGSMLRRLIIDVIADDAASGGKTASAMRGRFGLREAV